MVHSTIFSETGGEYYDAVYGGKDYKAESNAILEIIRKYKESPGNNLLDVACGTGKHDYYLVNEFDVTGIDFSKEQIARAIMNVPDAIFLTDDMRTLKKVTRKFDVVICMFSSIAYLETIHDVDMTISSLYKHLNPGGVLIVEPWLEKQDWDETKSGTKKTFQLGRGRSITREVTSKLEGSLSVLKMRFTVVGEHGVTHQYEEVHRMVIREHQEYMRIFEDNHFVSHYIKNDVFPRGLVIGFKPLL